MTKSPASLTPPVAERRDHVHREHDQARPDPYAWLREREDPAVEAYLRAENDYTAAVMAPTEAKQQRLYDEILGRIKQTDHGVPFRYGPFLYYSRTIEGKSYVQICRRPPEAGDPGEEADEVEQIVLDENALAEGHSYYDIGGWSLDPAHERVAYLADDSGDEHHTLHVRELATGAVIDASLTEQCTNLSTDAVWSEDGKFLFYVVLDEASRPYRVMRHRMGTPAADDVLIHEEADEAFFVGLSRTRSRRFLVMDIDSQVTSEVRMLAADEPEGQWWTVAPRKYGVEYGISHHGDRFFVLTNEDAINFRVMEARLDAPQREHWVEKIAHDPAIKLDSVECFADHLVIARRERGLPVLSVETVATGERHDIEMPEPVYNVWTSTNLQFDTQTLRFGYTSLVTPSSIFDYDLDARTRVRRKQVVVKGYDASRFVCERIEAEAADGTKVPISLVHRADLDRSQPQPTLLIGYGAYGSSYDPSFSSSRVSLLERGMIFAMAHVRGGGEGGRPWYEAGKLERKPTTFSDFVSCAQALCDRGYTEPAKLAIRGGSAGGLLMGAAVNLRPDLFGAVVADVPFVDVLSTMLDPSLPLTVIEYDEWGNPQERKYYDAMRSYSPYDNVEAVDHPPMLVLAGLNDPRVGYWEPAKWVAKLRVTKTDDNVLLLRTDMESGHAGPSGRYDALRETALWYAFVLEQLGVPEP